MKTLSDVPNRGDPNWVRYEENVAVINPAVLVSGERDTSKVERGVDDLVFSEYDTCKVEKRVDDHGNYYRLFLEREKTLIPWAAVRFYENGSFYHEGWNLRVKL